MVLLPKTTKKSSRRPLDGSLDSWYNTHMHDPDSFIYRLQHTIALLEVETQQGIEDWTPTINRLKEVLAEELSSCSVAA